MIVRGEPGQIAAASLSFDAISAIELTSGPAALVDLCYVPVSQNAGSGWTIVPGFPYPLCLPVTHPDYPSSGNQPVNEAAAQTLALSRVLYGPSTPFAGAPFKDLHEQLIELVVGGPGDVPMASRRSPAIAGEPAPPDPDVKAPTIPGLAPLDLVLLGSLHPAIAQMVGLYWVDRQAPPGAPFDYLIVADHAGRGGREPGKLLSWIKGNGFADIDGYIAFNLKREKAAALPPPDGLRAYALPGSTRATQGGDLEDASNNAGLRWDLGVTLGVLQPGHAIMYHVWRAGLGDADTPTSPASYGLLTKDGAVLVAEPHLPPGAAPERAADWPPFPLHYIDTRLAEGWYGYQVSGVDIFGRHSANSGAAPWYEWAPIPEPRPWYYQDPAADTAIHPAAIRLLDKTPPPPPTGVEAYALDPADPTVDKDASYDAWWAGLDAAERGAVTGLRVRWRWTGAHRRQAPDTFEFRIYYAAGRPNALVGRIETVTPAGASESDVQTDIAANHPADACVGAWLRVGGHSFPVVGSQAGGPLRLRVRNLGLTYVAGTISVTSGDAAVVGTGSWHAGMAGKSFQVAGDPAIYAILSVPSPTQLRLTRPYGGPSGSAKSYTIFDVRPSAGAACTMVIPPTCGAGAVVVTQGSPVVSGTDAGWNGNLVGQIFRADGHLGRYVVRAVNSPTELVLDKSYAGPSGGAIGYTISHPLFTDYSVAGNWEERFYVVGTRRARRRDHRRGRSTAAHLRGPAPPPPATSFVAASR